MLWLVFAIFLYLVCAILIIAEIFIPSGGIISICALAALIGGVTIFFGKGYTTGYIGILVAVVLIPIVVIISYKIFPKTRFGKSVILSPPKRTPGDAIGDTEQLQQLLGQTAKVLTPLRPVGTCLINDKRLECVAENGFIEKDQNVRVIKVEATQITVRIVEDKENS